MLKLPQLTSPDATEVETSLSRCHRLWLLWSVIWKLRRRTSARRWHHGQVLSVEDGCGCRELHARLRALAGGAISRMTHERALQDQVSQLEHELQALKVCTSALGLHS